MNKWIPWLAIGVFAGVLTSAGCGAAVRLVGSALRSGAREQVGDITIIYKNGSLSLAKYGAEGGVPYSVYNDIKLVTSCSGLLYNTLSTPVVCQVPSGSTLNINSTHVVLTEGVITGTDVYAGDLEP